MICSSIPPQSPLCCSIEHRSDAHQHTHHHFQPAALCANRRCEGVLVLLRLLAKLHEAKGWREAEGGVVEGVRRQVAGRWSEWLLLPCCGGARGGGGYWWCGGGGCGGVLALPSEATRHREPRPTQTPPTHLRQRHAPARAPPNRGVRRRQPRRWALDLDAGDTARSVSSSAWVQGTKGAEYRQRAGPPCPRLVPCHPGEGPVARARAVCPCV